MLRSMSLSHLLTDSVAAHGAAGGWFNETAGDLDRACTRTTVELLQYSTVDRPRDHCAGYRVQ